MSVAATIHRRSSDRVLAVVTAAVLLLSLMAVFAPPAWAHNGTVAWDCDGWNINLSAYQGATVDITVDGQSVASTSFQSGYSNSGSWDDSQSHTLQVIVNASDDNDQPVYNRGSNSSFSPNWQGGEYSFTLNVTQDACTQPPQDVAVTVGGSSCGVNDAGAPAGSIEVTIAPDSGATVNVYSDAAMTNLVGSTSSSTTLANLAPGTYYWQASAANGYQLSGPSSGSIVIGNCDVTVTVGGVCQVSNDVAVGEISVQISVDGGATVEVSDSSDTVVATFAQSGTASVPAGASYTWEATASPGFDLSGTTSGTIDIDDCTPPVVGASIVVTVAGTCVIEGDAGHGVITVTVSVADGATVVITDSDGAVVDTLTEDGSISVPEDAVYDWSATASAGFEFPPDFVSSGSITIEECTPTVVGASILVTVGGTCVVDGDDGEGVISVTVSVAGGATVVVSDSDNDVVGTFTDDGSVTVPEGAVYTWSATASDGFEFPSGFATTGSVTIETCSTPDVLPFTGAETDGLFMIGFMLLAAGLVVVTGSSFVFGWDEEA